MQINKEKNQAVVEFLTPEDATAALAFNGKSISGSILQFRRPRDYVDATATVRFSFYLPSVLQKCIKV